MILHIYNLCFIYSIVAFDNLDKKNVCFSDTGLFIKKYKCLFLNAKNWLNIGNAENIAALFQKTRPKSALSGFIKHCLHILDSTPDELKNNIFNTFEQNLI